MPALEISALLGANMVWNSVFKPIIEDLADDTAGDWAKDFCKDSLKSVFKGQSAWRKAVGLALKEFLEQFEQELIGAGEAESIVYVETLRHFIKNPTVRLVLGKAITDPTEAIDAGLLARAWRELENIRLHDDFNWQALTRRYQNKARTILRDSGELRQILDSQNLEQLAENIQQSAPLFPGFDLVGYAQAMREKYGQLKLESLDVTGSYYRELELWSVFIPQKARECQEYLPQVFELPKEHLRRLRKTGELEVELARAIESARKTPFEAERYTTIVSSALAGNEMVQLSLTAEASKLIGGEVLLPKKISSRSGKRKITKSHIEKLRDLYLAQTPRNVLENLDDPNRLHLVILGDPGSGKSSLLQSILLRWAEQPTVRLAGSCLPLLIELRAYAQARQRDGISDFLEFFHRGCAVPWRLDQHRLKELLYAGQVHVFFDGLDEVFDPTIREEVVNAICRFSNEYPRVRIIVTSRPIGYKGEAFRHCGFRHFMLQDLDDGQIAEFLHKWHSSTYRASEIQEKEEKHGRLSAAIADSGAIRELAGNPLLLTMMAILNRNQDLPRDRADLYEQCSRLLLYQWKVEEALRADADLAGDATAIGLKEKQIVLRRLAREMLASPINLSGNIIAADRLEMVIEDCVNGAVQSPRKVARALIRQLRERNFILCFAGGDSYAFVHRTFLEYFYADDVRVRFDYEKSIDLGFIQEEVYGSHWQDDKWREVLCLLSGMIHPKALDSILSYILKMKGADPKAENIFFAVRCFEEARDRQTLTSLSEILLKSLMDLAAYRGRKKARASVVRPSGEQIVLPVYDSEPSFRYAEKAVEAATRVWPMNVTVKQWLVTCAEKHEHYPVRLLALKKIEEYWGEERETLAVFQKLAQSDGSSGVREAAVNGLVRIAKHDPHTPEILGVITRSDSAANVRQTAMVQLANNWKSEEVTRIVTERLRQDLDEDVRYASVNAIAQIREDSVFDVLKGAITSDSNWRVRYSAIKVLCDGGADEARLQVLLKAGSSDEHLCVRQLALSNLSVLWKRDKRVFQLLSEKVRSDASESVRRTVREELNRNWKDFP